MSALPMARCYWWHGATGGVVSYDWWHGVARLVARCHPRTSGGRQEGVTHLAASFVAALSLAPVKAERTAA